MADPIQKPDDEQTAAELAKVAAEPLLPVEKALIITSLTIGVVLLVVLRWVTTTYLTINDG